MKRTFIKAIALLVSSSILSSCAVMFGSSNYNANVETVGHPDAKIIYNGITKGTGSAQFQVARKNAQKLTFVVSKEGCKDQTFIYDTATLRGWAIAGSAVTWGLIGLGVDGLTGSWWKPNVDDQTITKVDVKNFNYRINYEGCDK